MGATDRGLVRAVNEDRFAGEVFSPDFAYGVVCDGLGGENAGGVASALACGEIRRMMESSYREGLDERSVYMILESAVATANAVVHDKAAQDPASMEGMATTVCLALVTGGTAYLASVGDSRGYLLRGEELRQLTVDHTRAQMLLDQQRITPEELTTHPDRHSLTRAVGVVLGAFIFRLVYTVALRFDMPAFMLKLVSSVIVVLAISGPYLKSRWPMIRRRLTYRSGSVKGGGEKC